MVTMTGFKWIQAKSFVNIRMGRCLILPTLGEDGRLSADLAVSQIGGVWSANVMVTRQLDIAGQGTGIGDFSIGAAAFNTHFGGSLYNLAADLFGAGPWISTTSRCSCRSTGASD